MMMALGGCWVGSVVWIGFPAMTTNLVGVAAEALPAVAEVTRGTDQCAPVNCGWDSCGLGPAGAYV
jgi:hypothetical protein